VADCGHNPRDSSLDVPGGRLQPVAVRRRLYLVLIAFVLLDLILGLGWYLSWRRHHHHDAAIRAAARRYGVDPELVRAVVWRESSFDSQARGAKGELGLMQVREIPAEDWAVAEGIEPFDHRMCLDPRTNTLAGTWYLAKLIARYPNTDNPLVFALADYNAGRSYVLRWARGPAETNSEAFLAAMTFPGTRQYIRDILDRYHHP
jgi:soluble lytic murein transglycosylase